MLPRPSCPIRTRTNEVKLTELYPSTFYLSGSGVTVSDSRAVCHILICIKMNFYFGIGALLLVLVCLWDLPKAQKQNRTLAGYFLMNGELRLGGFVASILSANLSIGNFLVFVAVWGYAFGWGGMFWFLINLVLNVVSYIFFIPTFRSYLEDKRNSGTIHDFLSSTFANASDVTYRRRIRLTASAATIVGLLFAIIFELHLATDIASRVLGFDPIVVFGLLTLLICIYSGIGGFHTLIFTDIAQSFAMFAGTAAIVPILRSLSRSSDAQSLLTVFPLSLNALAIGWPSILGICVIGSGWFLVAMDQWQRTCATRDAGRTRRGMLWYLVSISGFAVVFCLLGMFVRSALTPSLPTAASSQLSGGANPLTDFFLAPQVVDSSPLLFALVAIALLAAAMSTANTFLIVAGHSFVSDLLIAVAKGASIHELEPRDDAAFVAVARSSIIGMGVFVIGVWLVMLKLHLLKDPLNFFFIAYSVQFALLAPMVLAHFPFRLWPGANVVFGSLCGGLLAALTFGFGFWYEIQNGVKQLAGLALTDWLSLTPVLTLLVGGAVLILGRLITGKRNA